MMPEEQGQDYEEDVDEDNTTKKQKKYNFRG